MILLPILFASCYSNNGFTPADGSTIPPRATITFYDDQTHGDPPKLSALLDGKPAAIKVAVTTAKPYRLISLTVDSDKTGALLITNERNRREALYTIAKPTTKPAKELVATTGRFHIALQHSSVTEVFDGLAVRFDPPAIPARLAHVKIRRDAKAAWSTFDAPVIADDKRSAIWLGELGCTANYTVPLLEAGVDLEITITLVDGTVLPLKLPSPHITLAKAPKKSPP